mmetsp:Transcript_33445/g.109085  ORF Transcript_33445/g.109085 Transcript_33445/m.109085 type:complete len:207 (-) Transcript_33445:41-661(-)
MHIHMSWYMGYGDIRVHSDRRSLSRAVHSVLSQRVWGVRVVRREECDEEIMKKNHSSPRCEQTTTRRRDASSGVRLALESRLAQERPQAESTGRAPQHLQACTAQRCEILLLARPAATTLASGECRHLGLAVRAGHRDQARDYLGGVLMRAGGESLLSVSASCRAAGREALFELRGLTAAVQRGGEERAGLANRLVGDAVTHRRVE